ncbi:DUF6141 family protein [Chloroflexota bacterium]
MTEASDGNLLYRESQHFYFLPISPLKTEVRSDGIYFKYFPFHLSFRKIPLESLRKYEAITYRPIRDYGGWGLKYGRKGRAYTARGNRGVQLELSDGRPVLIGSQKPEELVMAIDKALSQMKK